MKLLFLTILLLNGPGLSGQPRLLQQGLHPFTINKLSIENPDQIELERVIILGRNYKDEQILLFESAAVQNQRTINCYLYLDDEIQALQLELFPLDRPALIFEILIEINPYLPAVFCPRYNLLLNSDSYHRVFSREDLGVGDIYVFTQSPDGSPLSFAEMVQLLDRGIHLIFPEEMRPVQEPLENSRRGRLITFDPQSPGGIENILRRHRDEFLAYREQYQSLISRAEFHGIIQAAPGSDPVFPRREVRLQDIAQSLEQETFAGRLGFRELLILASFYIPCLILLILVCSKKILLPALAGLLLLFFLLQALSPAGDRIFRLELNPTHNKAHTKAGVIL